MADLLAPAVIAALVTAIASLIVAIVNAIATRKNQRDLADQTKKNQQELADLTAKYGDALEHTRANLAEAAATSNARREYEFRARQRLYEQVEPLFFQLIERSESAASRIRSLARTARNGDLGPTKSSWLQDDPYFLQSTIYRLFAPLAAISQIQRAINFVDLSLDADANRRYQVAKHLYRSFADDFEMATLAALKYDPWGKEATEPSHQKNAETALQGIPNGELDIAVDSLLQYDQNPEHPLIISFGKFQQLYADASWRERMQPVTGILREFHPKSRPVFWLILVLQYQLHRALIGSYSNQPGASGQRVSIRPISLEERKALDWRSPGTEAAETDILEKPFAVAQQYVEKELPNLVHS
jgi:hypothetical protein